MLTLTHDGELYRAPLKDDDIKVCFYIHKTIWIAFG